MSQTGAAKSPKWRAAGRVGYADAHNSWSIAMRTIGRIFSDRRGVSSIEYALVASLISIAAIAGYGSVGSKVDSSFSNTQEAIANNI